MRDGHNKAPALGGTGASLPKSGHPAAPVRNLAARLVAWCRALTP